MTKGFSRRGFLSGTGALAAAVAAPQAASGVPRPPDESGYELWLRYRKIDDPALLAAYRDELTHVVAPGNGQLLVSAADELIAGLSGLLGRQLSEAAAPRRDGAVVIGTPESSPIIARHVDAADLAALGSEGYLLRRAAVDGRRVLLVAGASERGVLYGAFALLRLLQTRADIRGLDVADRPVNPLRLANHWDNYARVVQWGYAGLSIFHWDELPHLRRRYVDYARALASIGMNGSVVNFINAEHIFLTSTMIRNLARLADVLRAWGVTMYLAVPFNAPTSPLLADDPLDTADPLDPRVRAWWRAKADEIYAAIPDFGGFLVKADSEGQSGPLQYGRTHADGANLLAEAVRPHGGIVMWRAFVGHWPPPPDIAKAAYEEFKPLDGKFADNAIVQVKFGPLDFGVREMPHPLFGGLRETNVMMELQIEQENTGAATHLCYLIPLWKQIYDADTHANGAGTTIASILSGSAFGSTYSGVAGVMNTGDDPNWTGHHLAAANLHGYGRLAWNPALRPAAIAEEWVRMTFGSDPRVVREVTGMLTSSWEIYESYVAPMMGGRVGGNQILIEFYPCDADTIGFDRTRTGTGMVDLYYPPVADRYNDLDTCPEELLLAFHKVSWDHLLRSGQTVIQRIYDSYFQGLQDAGELRERWRRLAPLIDGRRHAEVLARFDQQVEHAKVWRDRCVYHLFATSGRLDRRRSWAGVKIPYGSWLTRWPMLQLIGGRDNELQLSAANVSARDVTVTAAYTVAAGWSVNPGSVTLAPGRTGAFSTSVRPPLTPRTGVTGFRIDAGGLDRLGENETRVITVPDGRQCVLALDAGPVTDGAGKPIALLDGYQRLSPASGWDPARGFGWAGPAPQALDRGGWLEPPEPVRRDIVFDTVPRTLRVALPAGTHDAYLLVGDSEWLPVHATYLRSGGVPLAEAEEFLPGGVYTWLPFRLDGGSVGRTVDLELSGDPGHRWQFNALVLIDPGT